MKKNRDHLDELVTATAQKELAKTGMLQMRIEPALMERIYAAANEKGVRYTTLLRDWILDKLDHQGALQGKSQTSSEMTEQFIQVINQLNQRMNLLENQLAILSASTHETRLVKSPAESYLIGSQSRTTVLPSAQYADLDLSYLRPGESITVEIPEGSELIKEDGRLILRRPKSKSKTTSKGIKKAK